MKDLEYMEQKEFEKAIMPFVNKVVNEENSSVSFTIKKRFRTFLIDRFADKSVRTMQNQSNGIVSNQIVTPEGTFINVRVAAEHYDVPPSHIYAYIYKSKRKGNKDFHAIPGVEIDKNI